MSRGRFDRNRAARKQDWKSDYAALTGGLDQSSGAMLTKAGRMNYCLNFEEVYGQQGYTTIKGYERFDNMKTPSKASYKAIPFINGTASFALPVTPGQSITADSGASAAWLMTVITSGSFATNDAAGYFVVLLDTAALDFAADDLIRYSGNAIAKATGPSAPASSSLSFNKAAYTAARSYVRSLVKTVPGSGPIRGVAVFNNRVYVVRDDAAAGTVTASLYRTPQLNEIIAGVPITNFLQVKGGLHAGVRCHFFEATFTGDPKNKRLFFVNGRDRLGSVDLNDGFKKADPIYGSEATSATSLAIGTGSKTFTVAQASRSYVNSQRLIVYRDNNAGEYMIGDVTAYNSGTGALTINVISSSTAGSGPYSNWEIGLADYSDKPFLLLPYKNHMFLAYQGGQLQTSNLGDPFTYTTTATVFGLGQELTGMSSLKGKSLAVFCDRKIAILAGSSQIDWDLQDYTPQSGATQDTIQDNDGNPIYLNAIGIGSLMATQYFGDVAASLLSRDVKRALDAQRGNVIASRMAFGNNQYRLYFADGTNIRLTLMAGGGQQVLTSKSISPSISKYAHPATCVAQGTLNGAERMFFGTTDGHLMEEDSGTSFDGTAINYVLRMPFNHLKNPGVDKLFHKLDMDVTGQSPATLGYLQIFDYDDGTFSIGSDTIDSPGTNPDGLFDLGAFDIMQFDVSGTFRVEAPLDGQGRNMALLFWAQDDFIAPITLQGILLYFSLLGVRP